MSTLPQPPHDHAHDILRQAQRQPLDAIFLPRTIAVIGATEASGSVGRAVWKNLESFAGTVYPVNPKHGRVFEVQAFPSVAAVPGTIDLAVIVTPASTVPGVFRECVQAGVRGAIVISAGFKECGRGGAELERQILIEAKRGPIRVIGPNCLGVMTPHNNLNATFAAALARPGNVGFISQSGALCTAILDWSLRENVGFSAFVSVGSMLDVGWGDLIYYLGDDPQTRSIIIYMESVGEARSFLSAAREVSLTKPIIVLKVGRTEAAAKAAASHTGALTGSDAVLEAAFRRVGVLRVGSIEQLFDMAEVLAKQPRPHGPRLAILTNAGGPGALAADSLVASGGQLAQLSSETLGALSNFLPPHWSHGNPIDILGDADAERYARTVELAAQDPNTDGVLVVLTPQAMTDATATAERLSVLAKPGSKPILASWMGGPAVQAGEALLNDAGIPTFKYPDRAAQAFELMWRYSENLRALYETPTLRWDSAEGDTTHAAVAKIISVAHQAGRVLLTEFESKQLLASYGIPSVETHVALTRDDAVQYAERVGYPAVLKVFSETLTHKSDVGGVRLNLCDASAVRHAWKEIHESVSAKAGQHHFLGVTVQPMVKREGYELILGSSIDSQFGPVLLFGAGGEFVEVFKDHALGLPPLNDILARRLIEQTKIFAALQGVRGRKPVDLAALSALLVRFSQLLAEQPWISEIDINPLLVSSERSLALDARVILHAPGTEERALPKLAIRAYPTRYVQRRKMKDGSEVTIRPIRPEDERLMIEFHRSLSERSVYLRYFAPLRLDLRITHERLSRICFIDYDREMALVAERRQPKSGQPEILGVGRLSKLHGRDEAEFALVISDGWQRHGLGTELLRMLVQVGRDERLNRISAPILCDNHGMQDVARKVGFEMQRHPSASEVTATLVL